MKLNLGLESLSRVAPMSKAEKLKAYAEILELENVETKYPLIDICDTVMSTSNKRASIETLCADPQFRAYIGSASDPVEALRAAGVQSMESLFEDFYRWGPAGLIAGPIMASFDRIERLAKEGAAGRVDLDQKSVYLPKKSDWDQYKKKADAIASTIEYIAKDPAKADPSKVGQMVGGISGTTSKINWTDFTIRAISQALFPGTGAFIGAAVSGIVEKSAADKGWDESSFRSACNDIVTWIERVRKFKQIKGKREAPKEVISVCSRFIHALTKVIKNSGRGIAAIVSFS